MEMETKGFFYGIPVSIILDNTIVANEAPFIQCSDLATQSN